MKNIILYALIMLFVANIGFAQKVGINSYQANNNPAMKYLLVIPKGYDAEKTYNLLLYYHYSSPPAQAVQQVAQVWNEINKPDWVVACLQSTLASGGWSTDAVPFTEAVIAHVKTMVKVYDRIFASGHSGGGHMTYYLSLMNSTTFAGAMPSAGSLQAVSSWVNLDNAKNKAFYIIHGSADDLYPQTVAQDAATTLRNKGAVVNLRILNGVTHYNINQYIDEYKKGLDWLLESESLTAEVTTWQELKNQ